MGIMKELITGHTLCIHNDRTGFQGAFLREEVVIGYESMQLKNDLWWRKVIQDLSIYIVKGVRCTQNHCSKCVNEYTLRRINTTNVSFCSKNYSS